MLDNGFFLKFFFTFDILIDFMDLVGILCHRVTFIPTFWWFSWNNDAKLRNLWCDFYTFSRRLDNFASEWRNNRHELLGIGFHEIPTDSSRSFRSCYVVAIATDRNKRLPNVIKALAILGNSWLIWILTCSICVLWIISVLMTSFLRISPDSLQDSFAILWWFFCDSFVILLWLFVSIMTVCVMCIIR